MKLGKLLCFLLIVIVLLPACTSAPATEIVPTIAATQISSTPVPTGTKTDTVLNPKRPPACTFPLAQITAEESTPEEYTFSEPQVVLTAPQGNIYNIAEWLPDNQQVLMTEELRKNAVNGKPALEAIELYNPETGESNLYALRPITHELPLWQSELNAVIYPVINYTRLDEKTATIEFTRQLWVSYGNSEAAQMLADNLSQFPLAIKSDGSEALYLTDKKISKLDNSLKKRSSVLFDPNQWDYSKERRDKNPVLYKMTWQPSTSLVFLYSNGAMQGGGYTFILDTNTGRVCELNFGGWAEVARWSSDGRYLAFIKSTRYAFPTYSADLTSLDTVTGNLITLNVIPQEIAKLHFVYDFVWAPDNRHLLAIGQIYTSPDSQNEIGLYLIDFVSDRSVHVTPEYRFYTNTPHSMAWSPDGSKLVLRCPTMEIDQICFVSIQRKGR